MQLRDQSIQIITQGNMEFRLGSTYDLKQKGYLKMKSGCEMLLNYMKQEQNQTLKQYAKDHLVKIIEHLEEMKVYLDQYKKNMESQNALLMKQPLTQSDCEKWSKIVGIEKTKAQLAESIVIPLQFPDLFTGLRKPWRGILLFGPPGTGKESLAKACATKCTASFFFLTPEISQGTIQSCFQAASLQKKSLIFIKQIDQLQQKYEKAKIELITSMEQYADCSSIQVLGGTNIPWTIDTEILKRFEKKIYIQLPNYDRRRQLIMNQLINLKYIITDEQLEQMNNMLEGYTIPEINKLIKETCQQSRFQTTQTYNTPTPDMEVVTFNDFLKVLSKPFPDTSKYQEWNQRFGS